MRRQHWQEDEDKAPASAASDQPQLSASEQSKDSIQASVATEVANSPLTILRPDSNCRIAHLARQGAVVLSEQLAYAVISHGILKPKAVESLFAKFSDSGEVEPGQLGGVGPLWVFTCCLRVPRVSVAMWDHTHLLRQESDSHPWTSRQPLARTSSL